MLKDDIEILTNHSNTIGIDYSKIINNRNELEIIFELLNDIVILLDKNFQVVNLNSMRLLENLKYRKEYLTGKNFLQFIHKDDIPQIENLIKKNTDNIDKSPLEIRIKDKNQEAIWFDSKLLRIRDRNNKFRYIFILKNINEMKNAEEKYKNLFENSPNAIILLNFSGIIIDVNLTTIKMFNLDKDKLFYHPIHTFSSLYPSEIKAFFKKIFKAAFKGDFPEPIEAQLNINDDKIIWVLIQASLVKVKQSVLIQIIYQDITEKKKIELLEKKFKKQLEIEVKKRTEELDNALKEQQLYLDQILKSSQFKTEFMSTMSHELRTPLNAIIGFTDLLLEEAYGTLDNEQKEVILDIKVSAEYQFEMIKNILDISKIEAGHLKLDLSKLSIKTIINQVYSSFKLKIESKNLIFKIQGLDKDHEILADAVRIKEVFMNLMSNAIKFTEKGTIEIIYKEDDKNWVFIIRDTGIGIEEKDYNIIFKEFKRVESDYVRSKPGTGLGLSLTKRIINLHRGEIFFESEYGKGTKFTFNLPKKNEL